MPHKTKNQELLHKIKEARQAARILDLSLCKLIGLARETGQYAIAFALPDSIARVRHVEAQLSSLATDTAPFDPEREARRIMAQLTTDDIAYAASADRGEARGFMALHDLCNADTLLPTYLDLGGVRDFELSTVTARHDRVMEAVTVLLCAHPLAKAKGGWQKGDQ